MTETIGTLNEQPLHSALKHHYAEREGRQEVPVEGYFVDVVHEKQLIEIQTQHFYAIKKKLFELTSRYRLRLVYPIASEKWLLKFPKEEAGEPVRRKSPKRGQPYQVFTELVSFPELIENPNFTLDIAMVDVEEVRRYAGNKAWRQNGWKTVEQRLIRVVEIISVQRSSDLLALFPETLPVKFTSADLEETAGIPRWLAQKAAYCLRKASAVQQAGKRGRFNLYERTGDKTL